MTSRKKSEPQEELGDVELEEPVDVPESERPTVEICLATMRRGALGLATKDEVAIATTVYKTIQAQNSASDVPVLQLPTAVVDSIREMAKKDFAHRSRLKERLNGIVGGKKVGDK